MYIVEIGIPKLYFSSSRISEVIQSISLTKNYHTLTQNIFFLDIQEPGQHGTFSMATKECISLKDNASKRSFSCFGLLESFRGQNWSKWPKQSDIRSSKHCQKCTQDLRCITKLLYTLVVSSYSMANKQIYLIVIPRCAVISTDLKQRLFCNHPAFQCNGKLVFTLVFVE